MNPNAFLEPVRQHDARDDVELVEGNGLEQRLKVAAELASREHTERNSQPLLPIIIENEARTTIVISSNREENGLDYLIISRGATGPDVRIPNDRFQHIHFLNLADCRVFIMTKLIRVYFYNSARCQVSIREPLIGGLEFYRCNDTNLSTRISEASMTAQDQLSGLIPLTRIEMCQTFHIYQSNTEMIYLVKMSDGIKGTIIDVNTGQRLAEYPVGGKLFWDAQEQNLICLSALNGFATVPMRYALNDIEHHVMIRPLEDSGEFDDDMDGGSNANIFGTTPPSRGAMIPHLFQRK